MSEQLSQMSGLDLYAVMEQRAMEEVRADFAKTGVDINQLPSDDPVLMSLEIGINAGIKVALRTMQEASRELKS